MLSTNKSATSLDDNTRMNSRDLTIKHKYIQFVRHRTVSSSNKNISTCRRSNLMMSQLGWTFVVLAIVCAAAADDSCRKYREFQDAWAKLRDPVAAGLSLEDQQRLTSVYDPRRLNSADIANCTGNEKPSDEQNVVIQSWPTGGAWPMLRGILLHTRHRLRLPRCAAAVDVLLRGTALWPPPRTVPDHQQPSRQHLDLHAPRLAWQQRLGRCRWQGPHGRLL